MTRKREADQANGEHPSAGPGGKARERLKMFHEARGIPMEPAAHYADDYSAAVLAAITAAEAAGTGAANLPQWRFLGPDLIPNGQSSYTPARIAVSGRVGAIAIDPQNRNHLLCGSAAGGIWESFTRGTDWAPRTDFMRTLTTGAVAFDPNNAKNNTNIVYAGTGEGNSYWYFGQGVLKSTDGGTTWTLLPQPPNPNPFVGVGFFGVIVDPGDSQHLLAATQGLKAVIIPATATAAAVSTPATGGVYESADGGATWAQVYAAKACWDISMQPGGSTRQADGTRIGEVLAATSDGLLRSGDGGHSWPVPGQPDPAGNPPLTSRVQLPGAPTSWTRLAVSISPADTAVAYAFGASGGTAYLWRRSAGAWTALSTPAPIDPDTGKPDSGWASQAGYDWYAAAAPGPFPAGTSDQVYLGAKRVFRGDLAADGKTLTWADLTCKTQGDCLHDDQHAIAFDPADPATIYAAGDGGVFRSPDRGVSWVSLNAGLGITEIEYMVHDNANSRWLLAGTQDNGTIRYLGTSTFGNVDDGDGGDCGIDQTPRTPDPVTGQTPPATCYDSFTYMWTERSTQGGDRGSFTVISPVSRRTRPNYQSLFYPPVGVSGSAIAKAGESVFVSRNTGMNWDEVKLPWADYGTPRSDQYTTALWLPSSNLVYAATKTGLIFKIDYSGIAPPSSTSPSPAPPNPTKLTRLLRPAYVSAIRTDPNNRIWVATSQVGDGTVDNGQVFRSDDDGATWTDKTGYSADTTKNLPRLPITSIAFDNTNADRVWVSADVGVYQSTDGGTTWAPFFRGLPYVIVEDLEFHPVARVLRAGTRSRGIWEAAVDQPGTSAWPAAAACIVTGTGFGPRVTAVGTDGSARCIQRPSRSADATWSAWEWVSGGTVSSPIQGQPVGLDDRVALFARGTDGALWYTCQATSGGAWRGWQSLGGILTGNPVIASAAGSAGIEIFARGPDGALWRTRVANPGAAGSGSTWQPLGGAIITATPAVAWSYVNAQWLVEVFARTSDGTLAHIRQSTPGQWTGSKWESLGGNLAGRATVDINSDGTLQAFARWPDNTLRYAAQTAPGSWSWTAWQSLGGNIAGDPQAASYGQLTVFARGTDNTLWQLAQNTPGSWQGSAWQSLGGNITSDPVAARYEEGRTEVFALGTDNALWRNVQNPSGSGWAGWATLGGGTLRTFP